jgi:pyruvate dehydrogenase E1 component beta subunit
MLRPALDDPDPVVIFEHGGLYNVEGEVGESPVETSIERAVVRRAGGDLTIITFGGTLSTSLAAAESLAGEGIDAEVVDLRSLRPLDTPTLVAAVARTHRAVVVDEGCRSGGISAEIASRLMEHAFYELDAPVARVCSAEVPMPYPKHLEDAALPSVARIVAASRAVMRGETP